MHLLELAYSCGANSSGSAINRGDQFKVKTKTIITFLKEWNIKKVDFIKVDIEGAEEFIVSDIIKLSKQYSNLVVLLCIHVPKIVDTNKFWNDFSHIFHSYNVYLAKEEQLISEDVLKKMVLSTDKSPSWGEYNGNFFDVILKVK